MISSLEFFENWNFFMTLLVVHIVHIFRSSSVLPTASTTFATYYVLHKNIYYNICQWQKNVTFSVKHLFDTWLKHFSLGNVRCKSWKHWTSKKLQHCTEYRSKKIRQRPFIQEFFFFFFCFLFQETIASIM